MELLINRNTNNKPYESCIKFDGKSILPPIITPSIEKEMSRYRALAMEVERRIRASRQKNTRNNDEDQNKITDDCNLLQTSSTMHSCAKENVETCASSLYQRNVIGVENYPTDFSSTPSVASTYLAKYMRPESCISESGLTTEVFASPNLEMSDLKQQQQQYRSSQSNTSTLVEKSSDVTEDDGDVPRHRIRKLSYTLDQPSPLLVAQMKNLTCESNGGGSVTVVGDEDAIAIEKDSEKSSYCTARTSSDIGRIHDGCGRQEHLHRYLQQVNQICDTGKEDNKDYSTCLSDASDLPLSSADNQSAISYEQMLVEKEKHYEDLRLEMERQHRLQLDALEQRKEREFDILRRQQVLLFNNNNFTHRYVPTSCNGYEEQLNDSSFVSPGSNQSFSYADDTKVLPTEALPQSLSAPNYIFANRAPFSTKTNKKSSAPYHCELSPEELLLMKPKFDKVSAAAKGYLTRRLLRTEKAQNTIKTIKDTLEFAYQLHSETPMKQGRVTSEAAVLHQRILAQLSSACYDFHDIFFKLPTKEQMALISLDRASQREKHIQKLKEEVETATCVSESKRMLTSATLKAIERRRHRMSESRSSAGSRSSHSRKITSPCGRLTPKNCQKKLRLSSVGRSAETRSTSPRLQGHGRNEKNSEQRTATSLSNKSHLQRVRRSLYSKRHVAKTIIKSTKIQ